MKNKNWLLVALTVGFLIIFVGYRQIDRLRSDTQAPQIHVDETRIPELSVLDPEQKLLEGITASDRKDGDVTDSLVVESIHLLGDDGLMEVGYAATDSAGNVAKISRQIRYTDYVSPRFTLNTPLIYSEYQRFDVLNDVGAVDVIDGDIQHRIRASALTEDSISDTGIHPVHFQVTNSFGDTSEIELPVEVRMMDGMNASLTLTDYLIYLPVGAEFRPEAYLDSFSCNVEKASLRNGMPRDYVLQTVGQVDTGTEGVYSISYTVVYALRHETNPDYDQYFTGYSKLIVVVEG